MLAIVQEIGAAAGLSAVVGLAALSVLYFSQARDVKRLREWAGRAPERSGRGVTAVPRPATRAAPKRNGAAVKPGNVTVAVLNGTTVPGLAATLSQQIGAAGFKKGTIDVFSDQQLAESVVQYASGHQAEAKAVSRRLGISRLEPVTANSRALAGNATVIVIAGADKAP